MQILRALLNAALLATLLALAGPGLHAQQQVNGAQLEAILAGAPGRPDHELARQLAKLQLTERLGASMLARCQAALPGTAARQQLTALADTAAFLDAPVANTPQTPAPSLAEQRRMLALTVNYVSRTVNQLPNFSATRTTTNFQGGPDQPWSFVSRSSASVIYRKGEEELDTHAGSSASQGAAHGLATSGEFGPILGTVMLDAAQSNLAWSHWEQGASGPEAVFRFSVSAAKSHYELGYCCIYKIDSVPVPVRQLSGYHGELAIDPVNGMILRLLLRADLKKADPLLKADILVEYASVEIGQKSYLCPVRSVAYSVAGWSQAGTWLNDVVFEQYHVFRSDSRILPGSQ